MNLSTLPKSIPELHKIIVLYSEQIETQTGQITAKDEQIEIQTEQITVKDEQITTQDKKITVLEEEVKLLRKLRFAHKSEKWTNQDNKQSLLFNEAELTLESPKQDDSEKTITITYTRKKAGRKKLDPNLPRKGACPPVLAMKLLVKRTSPVPAAAYNVIFSIHNTFKNSQIRTFFHCRFPPIQA